MANKAIFNSYIAKQLIKSGNRVVDIQPDKCNSNSIIFYFEITDKFKNDLSNLSHNNK